MTAPNAAGMTIREAIGAGARQLAAASATARLDAELLMAHALGISRETMLLKGLDVPSPEGFQALVARRAAGEPIAYIVGWRDFWTLDLIVTPDVLIPRPDSETLIEAALVRVPRRSGLRILDLGTGSGALLLAALSEWRDATGVGVDRSTGAVAVARANAARNQLNQRASFIVGDWGAGLEERFDLIFCNPPYIEDAAVLPRDVAGFEPASALFAGADGLSDYRRIIPSLPGLMADDARAFFEIGCDQAGAVSALAIAQGFDAEVVRDLGDRDRCVILRKI